MAHTRYFSPKFLLGLTAFLTCLCISSATLSQGQDSTRAERDIMIISELLPGRYINTNQTYFDNRLKVPKEKRHSSLEIQIERLDAPDFGDNVFVSRYYSGNSGETTNYIVYSFQVDNEAEAVRMKTYSVEKEPRKNLKRRKATYRQDCDLLWQQEAAQFHGRLESKECALSDSDTRIAYDMFLSEDAFWVNTSDRENHHYALDRARSFDCYIDVPGVSSGIDIPYEHYKVDDIHDLGGEKWTTIEDGSEVGLRLFRVRWPINNVDNTFARPSFVLYVNKKDEKGESKRQGYAFSHVDSQRIGINLMWMLANCYMISNEDVTPFYMEEPRL